MCDNRNNNTPKVCDVTDQQKLNSPNKRNISNSTLNNFTQMPHKSERRSKSQQGEVKAKGISISKNEIRGQATLTKKEKLKLRKRKFLDSMNTNMISI